MTREEYVAKQGELLASVRTNVQEYNNAYGEKRFDDASSINATIEKDVDEYNSIAQMLCFDELSKAEPQACCDRRSRCRGRNPEV